MGQSASTISSRGTLQGAHTPSLRPDVAVPKLAPPKSYEVVVPANSKPGDIINILIAGKTVAVKVPKGKRSGDTFIHQYEGEIEKVYASTLPTLPGMEVILAKPVIWGSLSLTFAHTRQQSVDWAVGRLMQGAQSILLQQVLTAECNAVLGVSYNVTIDSSGELRKTVVVTCHGTPCVAVVQAEANTGQLRNY